MRSATTASPLPLVALSARFADYAELTKPRVALLVLFTVFTGTVLASGGVPDGRVLVHVLLGTALVAAGASAWNQFYERDSDALMRRTGNRPLPAGRMQPTEVLVFALGMGLAGIGYLAAMLVQPTAAFVAAITFVLYAFVYTPLKRKTTLNTLIGAVPGALPPIIGWTAVRGTLDAEAIALFVVLFLWQVPHFLAIAWIYRDDYARAGLRMLTVVDREGGVSGRQMVCYCLALIPASLAPVLLGKAGPMYLAGAILLGLFFLRGAVGFLRMRTAPQARQVLHASLLYLPALLALLLLDSQLSAVRGPDLVSAASGQPVISAETGELTTNP